MSIFSQTNSQKSDFILNLNIDYNNELKRDKIIKQLPKSTIPLNNMMYLYEIKNASLSEIKHIFESLKPFIEVGEYINYYSVNRHFADVFYRYKNEFEMH